MPNQAFIEYNKKGFWIPESYIELLSDFICKAFEGMGFKNLSENLLDIYDSCDGNRLGQYGNMVDIPLDENFSKPVDKSIFISILEDTKSLILTFGAELTVVCLNEMESKKTHRSFMNNGTIPIQTHSLLATINIMEQMLNDTWESNNFAVYYTDFPKPEGITPI